MSNDHSRATSADGSSLAKSDPRLAAAMFCEDAAACIGLAIALGGQQPGERIQLLGGVQNDLVDVAADLSSPTSDDAAPVRIDQGYSDRARYLVDHYSRDLDDAAGAVVPGGTAAGALIHKARASVRLADVHAWQAADSGTGEINPAATAYLDQVDDLLLVLARRANVEHGDQIWQPGWSAREAAQAEQNAAPGPGEQPGPDTTSGSSAAPS